MFAEIYTPRCPPTGSQAEDRAHRITQQSACSIYYCVASNSIDEAMWRLLERKISVRSRRDLGWPSAKA